MKRDAAIKLFQKKRKAYEKATGKHMFDPFAVLAQNCKYNFVYGERSNGKTYGALFVAMLDYVTLGRPFAIVRRYHEDLVRRRAVRLFDPLIKDNWVYLLTDGEWDGIYYNGGMWYLSRQLDGGKEEHSKAPFAYAYELTAQEHDKSSGDLPYKNIVFDEAISRNYLIDEFVLFMNTCSTIIRNKTDVIIWMCGNTINPYGCPYFREMGLKHAREMQPGAMEVYTYGQSQLQVCVCRTEPSGDKSSSAFYFAFDNPKLNMITGGDWEIDIYPHIPHKIRPADVRFNFFIKYEEELLHCKVIKQDNAEYIIVHPKTTELQQPDKELVFCLKADPRRNWYQYINKPANKKMTRIWQLFTLGKVFYSDNMTGEVMRNYLDICAAA